MKDKSKVWQLKEKLKINSILCQQVAVKGSRMKWVKVCVLEDFKLMVPAF